MAEIIAEQRKAIDVLLTNQQHLLETVLHYSDMISLNLGAMAVYRRQFLEGTKDQIEEVRRPHSCAPGCRRHCWDDVDGWKYKDK